MQLNERKQHPLRASVARFIKPLFALAVTLSLTVAALAFGSMQVSALSGTTVSTLKGKINAGCVNVRTGAGTNNKKIKSLSYKSVKVTGFKKGTDGKVWYKISSPVSGYVRSDYITASSNSVSAKVIKANVNVRKKATTSSVKVKTINNKKIKIVGFAAGKDGYLWYKISSPCSGYIRSDLVVGSSVNTGSSKEEEKPGDSKEEEKTGGSKEEEKPGGSGHTSDTPAVEETKPKTNIPLTNTVVVESKSTKSKPNDPTTPIRHGYRYISQCGSGSNISPAWRQDYWGTSNGKDGCAVAATSMALSTMGIDYLPKDIIKANGSTVFMQWAAVANKLKIKVFLGKNTDFDKCFNRYKDEPGKYSAPIVSRADGHKFVVIDKNSDGSYKILDSAYWDLNYSGKFTKCWQYYC